MYVDWDMVSYNVRRSPIIVDLTRCKGCVPSLKVLFNAARSRETLIAVDKF